MTIVQLVISNAMLQEIVVEQGLSRRTLKAPSWRRILRRKLMKRKTWIRTWIGKWQVNIVAVRD